MKQDKTTVTVSLVNDDSRQRALEVRWLDANLTEGEYSKPNPLAFGGKLLNVSLAVDGNGYGALDWKTKGTDGDPDNGNGRRLTNGSEVKVWLRPA
jgi:hypothetical protein